MPSQYSQSWARGFSPLFSGPHSDQHLRVSDAERQAVTDRLAEHFGDGRLDQAEFDERVGRAMNAKTRADLGGLFDDLPETGAPARPERPRRRRRGHPALVLVLLFVLALTARPCALLGRRAIAVARVARGGRLVRDQGRRAHPRGPRPLAAPAASSPAAPRAARAETAGTSNRTNRALARASMACPAIVCIYPPRNGVTAHDPEKAARAR